MRTATPENTRQRSKDEVIRQCEQFRQTNDSTGVVLEIAKIYLKNPADPGAVLQSVYYMESKLGWGVERPDIGLKTRRKRMSPAAILIVDHLKTFNVLKQEIVDAMKSQTPLVEIAKAKIEQLQDHARQYYPDFDASRWLDDLFEEYQKNAYATLLNETIVDDCRAACPAVDELYLKYQSLCEYCQVSEERFKEDAEVTVQRVRLGTLMSQVYSEYGSSRQDARDFNSFVAKFAGQYNEITGCQGTHAAAQWLCDTLKDYGGLFAETAWGAVAPRFEESSENFTRLSQMSLQVYKAEHPEVVAQQMQGGAGAGAGAGVATPCTAVYVSQPVQTPELLASKQRLKMAKILVAYAENKVREHWPSSSIVVMGNVFGRSSQNFLKPREAWYDRMGAVSTILDKDTPINEAMACFYDAMKQKSILPAKRNSACEAVQHYDSGLKKTISISGLRKIMVRRLKKDLQHKLRVLFPVHRQST